MATSGPCSPAAQPCPDWPRTPSCPVLCSWGHEAPAPPLRPAGAGPCAAGPLLSTHGAPGPCSDCRLCSKHSGSLMSSWGSARERPMLVSLGFSTSEGPSVALGTPPHCHRPARLQVRWQRELSGLLLETAGGPEATPPPGRGGTVAVWTSDPTQPRALFLCRWAWVSPTWSPGLSPTELCIRHWAHSALGTCPCCTYVARVPDQGSLHSSPRGWGLEGSSRLSTRQHPVCNIRSWSRSRTGPPEAPVDREPGCPAGNRPPALGIGPITGLRPGRTVWPRDRPGRCVLGFSPGPEQTSCSCSVPVKHGLPSPSPSTHHLLPVPVNLTSPGTSQKWTHT